MGTEEKVSDAFSGVPDHMRWAVNRWMDDCKDLVNSRPINWDALRSHPYWPIVVEWARHFPSSVEEIAGMQKAILHRDDSWVILKCVYMFGSKSEKRRIVMPPAKRLADVGRFLLTKDAYKRYVEPHVADIHHEYFEALKAGQGGRARMIVVLGYLRVLRPLLAGLVATARALWKISGA